MGRRNKRKSKILIYSIILVCFLAGGYYLFFKKEKGPEISIESQSPSPVVSLSADLMQSALEILPVEFNHQRVFIMEGDFNLDGKQDIFITSLEREKQSEIKKGYFGIFSNSGGKAEKIGEFISAQAFNDLPALKQKKDLDNDGVQELQVDLGYGGASSNCEGILKIDFSGKNFGFLQVKNEKSVFQDAEFCEGMSAVHFNYFFLKNLDGRSGEEIAEVSGEISQGGLYLQSNQVLRADAGNPEIQWLCEAKVYSLSDRFFTFNSLLSAELAKILGENCLAPDINPEN